MYRSQIINVIIGVIVTFFLNVGLSYLTMDRGHIVFGEVFYQEKQSLQPLEIMNHSGDTLESMQFIVPDDLDLKAILITEPLIINELDNSIAPKGKKLIEISGVVPKSTARLLIPIDSKSSPCCEFLNYEELKLEVKKDSEVVNPMQRIFLEAAVSTIIYGSIIITFSIWISRKLKREEAEYKESLSKIEKKAEKNEEYLDELRLLYKRQRYMLLRRIKEYQKEIEFWRTAVRKQLLSTMTSEDVEEKLLAVSKKLNTRSTHGNIQKEYDNFEDSILLAEEASDKVK
ncbi:hypothetical protein [Photobacterium swingsii]|uniref:hypothetical protein n=1 Tax=Photobacterium swingsii TaxID=680026 RepID=UPI0040682141